MDEQMEVDEGVGEEVHSEDVIIVYVIEEIVRSGDDEPMPPSLLEVPVLFLDEDDVFWCIPQIVYPTPVNNYENQSTHERNENLISFVITLARLMNLPADDIEMIALSQLDDQRQRDFIINIKYESEP